MTVGGLAMRNLQYIDFGHSSWPLSVVSLHGFPSVRSQQNRELAENISRILQKRVRVVLYPGLSCEGEFSFEQTLKWLMKEFPELIEQYRNSKIQLLGHSWGGFCALALAQKFPEMISKIVLLSPLLQFNAKSSQVRPFFEKILSDNPQLRTVSADELAGEFASLAKRFPPQQLISSLDPKIEIDFLQARSDEITPTAVAEEMRAHFRGKLIFELVDQDHSFLIDRPKLSQKIAELFR